MKWRMALGRVLAILVRLIQGWRRRGDELEPSEGEWWRPRKRDPTPKGEVRDHDKEKVVARKMRTVPWKPEVLDDSEGFDPAAHSALPELQMRVVHALFARLGLEWIPGEYLTLLGVHHSPVEAFTAFATEYGLRIDRLRKEDPREKDLLGQVVGILLELRELGAEVPADYHALVFAQLRKRQWGEAEALVDAARIGLQVIHETEALEGVIGFAAYKGFATYVRGFRTHLHDLSRTDAKEARAVNQRFQELYGQFVFLVDYIDQMIAWMVTYWPENDWGTENTPVRDGLVATKENIEEVLKTSDEVDVEGLIRQIATIRDDLEAFIAEVKENYEGGEWDCPEDGSPRKLWEEWCKAARTLGFSEDDTPDAAAVKKAYRKMAMKHHPDRWETAPAAVKKEHEDAFKDAAEARTVLEKPKPEKA